jgi:hypothetical protein
MTTSLQDFGVIMKTRPAPPNEEEFFGVIMAPADQEWWWYPSLSAADIGQKLTENKAMLTDISAYVDVDNSVKYAVIMAPVNQEWWWYPYL